MKSPSEIFTKGQSKYVQCRREELSVAEEIIVVGKAVIRDGMGFLMQ